MMFLNATSSLDDLTGSYGKTWKAGILSEHRAIADSTPNIRFRNSQSGATWAYDTDDLSHPAVRVLCSEPELISTEDGMITGRCGEPTVDGYFCQGHAEMINDDQATCEHGLSAWLCTGPSHY